MSPISHIKKSDITRWTDEVYFQRGLKYYEQGAIYEQRQQGMTIRSKCSGSQAPFYRQEVLFDENGIKSAECSCPVGDGGRCKHAVALLLTWLNDPDSFQEVEDIDTVLDKRSKPELIAIVKEMLEQEPDLESLLELPLGAEEKKPLNVKAIRQQANRAFQGTDFEWGYAREIKRELNPLLKLAASYQSRNDAENSALIYETLIESILDNGDAAVGDEEGELLGVMYDCAEELGKCLSTIKDAKKRREILQVLFSAYEWDSGKMGGTGAADCVPEILTTRTTAEERFEIAKWTREIMPKGNDWSDDYHRKVLGGLLLNLEADILDNESYLKVCRETGRLNDLLERLLELKRVKEAEDAARVAEDYPLYNALNIFVKHSQTNLAEKLVTERLSATRGKEVDDRLIEWLAERLDQRGDLAGSLKLQERLFWKYPNVEKYEQLRAPAKKLQCWDNLRAHIINELEKNHINLVIEIYLFEKETELALASLEKLSPHWGNHSLHLEVAQAAKRQYPKEAVEIFVKEAQRFINYRNRENYSQAALCLREIRDIYRGINDMNSWNKLIAEIREKYKRLPALQDELNQLRL